MVEVTTKTSTRYGGSVTDAARVTIVGTGNWFQTTDDDGQKSPLLVKEKKCLAVPEQALRLTIFSDNPLRISELEDMSSYFVLQSDQILTIDTARLAKIYLEEDSEYEGCTVQFYFHIV